MQLLLLRYREDLIAAKLGRERAEERGRGELGAARERLVGAERARAGLERQHRAELQDLQTKAAALDGVLSELASEKEGRARLGERLARLEARQVAETAEQQSQAAAALSDKEG